jgi:hypothetical protein
MVVKLDTNYLIIIESVVGSPLAFNGNGFFRISVPHHVSFIYAFRTFVLLLDKITYEALDPRIYFVGFKGSVPTDTITRKGI